MKKYKESKSTSKYGRKYTDEFKDFVCQDYLKGEKTKADLWREHIGGDSEHGNLTKWLRELGYSTDVIPRSSKFVPMKEKNTSNQTIGSFEELQMKKRIAELEKQLKDAELKAIAFSTMVDIAEKEFNIPIRKKLNTKP